MYKFKQFAIYVLHLYFYFTDNIEHLEGNHNTMDVGEIRNVLLISSIPPKPRLPARKRRPIGIWGAYGENLQGNIINRLFV